MMESSGLWALLGRLARRQLCTKQSKAYFHSTRCLAPPPPPATQSLAREAGTGVSNHSTLPWAQASRACQGGSARGFAALGCGEEVSGGQRHSGWVVDAFQKPFGRLSNACGSGSRSIPACERAIHTTNVSQSDRDFYEVLGVPRSADAREIKHAYYRLAKKLHPDSSKETDANEKFQELQRAYSTLKDSEKRRIYDQLGHENFERMESSGAEGGGDPFGEAFTGSVQDIFNAFMGGERRGGFQSADDFFGGGGFGGGAFVAQVQQQVHISFMESIEGCSRELTVRGAKQRVKIEFEPGVESGDMLSVRPTPTLELILNVVVIAHKIFKREGLSILRMINVDVVDAMLGTTITVETVKGKTIHVVVPECTQYADRLVVSGEGVRTRKKVGDFILIVKLITPTALSERQRSILVEFQNEGKMRKAA